MESVVKDREICPICGGKYPFTVIKGCEGMVISAYCKHCKQVSIIRYGRKE